MEKKSCCFTGHRSVVVTDELKTRLTDTICRLAADGVTDFYAGGALGWDILCEQAVLHLKQFKGLSVKLHLVLPCSMEFQTAKWSEKDRSLYKRIREKADSVTVLSDKYYNGCMKVRNQRMVDSADVCVCYFNERDNVSGTGQTVRMAERKGIPVINLF